MTAISLNTVQATDLCENLLSQRSHSPYTLAFSFNTTTFALLVTAADYTDNFARGWIVKHSAGSSKA